MSNNVTRKGLAFGALVALTSTAIAGAPAFATQLTVAPQAGTSFKIASGEQFTLATTFAPGFAPNSYTQLKYIVKTDANSTVKFATKNTTTGLAADVTAATAQAVSTTSSAIAGASTGALDISYIGLSAVTTSETSAVEVTAFVDANNDGALTAGEWNNVKTVTFLKAADIAPVVTLTQPSTGDTSVSATVNWGDLNIEQMANEVVKFTVAGGNATNGTLASGTWSLSGQNLASGAAVTAQAFNGATALGTAASATATARTINTTNGLVANLVAGDDALATSASAIANTTGGVVRLNGSFVAQVKAFDTTSGTALAAPGVAVVGSVATSNTTLRPAATGVTEISITVNGTKYTTNASLSAATFALTTDATGVANLNISSVGLSLADTVTATFAAQNLSSSVQAVQTATKYIVTDDAATGASIIVAADKNAATTFNYTVKDQFGVLSSATNQRLKIVATQGSAVTTYAAVTAGKATFSVSPATDVTTDIDVDTTLQFSTTDSASNVNWADAATTGTATLINASTSNVVDRTIKVRTAAFTFTTAPEIDATNGINGGAWTTSGDQKQTITQLDLAGLNAAAPNAVAVTHGVVYAKLNFTGSNAGEAITVSGTDVYVAWAGGTASANTATKIVQTAANTVYVAANTVGTKTITFTNGTVTKTVDVKFASASAAEVTATKFDLTLPEESRSGTTVDAKVKVTDKWGNPVSSFDVTFTVSGKAHVNFGYSANATTDASGEASVKVTSGVNDLGDAIVTVSDNDSNTAASANVTSVAKTIAFGPTAADRAEAAAKAAAEAAAAAEAKAKADALAAAEKAKADALAAAEKAKADALAAALALRAKAKTFTVSVPTQVQAGRAIDATVTVTDADGAPVANFNLLASVAGVAAINGQSAANVVTDANGKATVKLTAGINDLGDAVVTFADNDVATETNVTAVAKTVTFGQTDGFIDVLNGKRASVTWSMAKGKRVTFLVNGVRKYNFVQTGDAELNLQFNLKKGTNNIKLLIGGVLVDDLTVNITK